MNISSTDSDKIWRDICVFLHYFSSLNKGPTWIAEGLVKELVQGLLKVEKELFSAWDTDKHPNSL